MSPATTKLHELLHELGRRNVLESVPTLGSIREPLCDRRTVRRVLDVVTSYKQSMYRSEDTQQMRILHAATNVETILVEMFHTPEHVGQLASALILCQHTDCETLFSAAVCIDAKSQSAERDESNIDGFPPVAWGETVVASMHLGAGWLWTYVEDVLVNRRAGRRRFTNCPELAMASALILRETIGALLGHCNLWLYAAERCWCLLRSTLHLSAEMASASKNTPIMFGSSLRSSTFFAHKREMLEVMDTVFCQHSTERKLRVLSHAKVSLHKVRRDCDNSWSPVEDQVNAMYAAKAIEARGVYKLVHRVIKNGKSRAWVTGAFYDVPLGQLIHASDKATLTVRHLPISRDDPPPLHTLLALNPLSQTDTQTKQECDRAESRTKLATRNGAASNPSRKRRRTAQVQGGRDPAVVTQRTRTMVVPDVVQALEEITEDEDVASRHSTLRGLMHVYERECIRSAAERRLMNLIDNRRLICTSRVDPRLGFNPMLTPGEEADLLFGGP